MKKVLLSFSLFTFEAMFSQDIPFDKLYGNSDPVHYYLGHYPVSNSDGLDINWYGGIKLQTSAGIGIQLLNNGNVGIGTSSPSQKLDVLGNIITGSTHATEGVNALSIRYENGSLNNWGSLRSSAASYMSFGVKADNNIANGWLSSNETLNFSKVAMILNDDGIKFLSSPQQLIALNLPVAMNEIMKIAANGNAFLQGKFEAKEIKVTLTPTADFVFDENYNLPKLEEIEKHIKEKKHLPEIASAAQMEKEGVNIGEFQIKLLQKIEELTLYIIEQNRQLKQQAGEIEVLKKQINTKK
ncbi:hypothetical protein [Chryseobacterium antibioticum]|uniref:hypothetical protein n=1 Tax=Chryseobacterium antibioticum TaxID=2728847 RepID=UPI001E3D7C3B|nr:hypothetical protein [Chryseobacterium antibioticum]